MKKFLLTAVCLLMIGSLMAQRKKKKTIDRFEGLDTELQTVLDTWSGAGFAVAVVEKDQIVYAKGFGYRDYENKVAVTPNTLFAIGSVSKSFTSAVLGKLRADDKVDFSESPATYIPDLRFFNDEMNNQITVRDMMCHRTGLPRHDIAWYLFPTEDREELVSRIAHHEPFADVRERWYYNNFMFMAQGVIAEKITGKSWEDNVREHLFGPLGMERSNVSIKELEAAEDVSLGYEVNDEDEIEKMDYYRIRGMAPAGSINSSVNEMANWLITWINGGQFKGEEIIPAGYVREAISSQMVIDGALPGAEHPDMHFATYGYGWMMSSYSGHYRVEHGGGIDGFTASACFFPSDSIGIVVLSNQAGSPVPSIVRNTLSDRMLKLERRDWNGEIREQFEENRANQEEATEGSSKVAGTRPSHILPEYTGSYSHEGYGNFEIVHRNDSLFAEFSEEKLWLRHYHYDVFESFFLENGKPDTAEAFLRFQFSSNPTGDISGVSIPLEPALDHPVEFDRTPSEVEVDEATLEQYVGEYELAGQEIKVYTKETTLYVFVPGQPEYELLATGEHKFAFKTLDGFKLEFVEGDEGISEVKFIQPNGTFAAKRKK
jgi:CubicO group peptidase (beta-lactamase class C family)